MHRNVFGLRDEPQFAIEDRARMIEPLFDVRRVRGVAHRDAHLFARVEQPRDDDLGGDRIQVDAIMPVSPRSCCRRRRPWRVQPAGSQLVVSYCSMIAGPSKRRARAELLAIVDRRVDEAAGTRIPRAARTDHAHRRSHRCAPLPDDRGVRLRAGRADRRDAHGRELDAFVARRRSRSGVRGAR